MRAMICGRVQGAVIVGAWIGGGVVPLASDNKCVLIPL